MSLGQSLLLPPLPPPPKNAGITPVIGLKCDEFLTMRVLIVTRLGGNHAAFRLGGDAGMGGEGRGQLAFLGLSHKHVVTWMEIGHLGMTSLIGEGSHLLRTHSVIVSHTGLERGLG